MGRPLACLESGNPPLTGLQVSTKKKRAKRPYQPRGWKKVFLALLAQTGNVTASADGVGKSRDAAYKARRANPDFAEAWEDAKEEALDAMEAEAWRRGMQGVDEPVFYQGEVRGHITKYSDTLLIFMLKAGRPHKFRERHQVDVSGRLDVGVVAQTLRDKVIRIGEVQVARPLEAGRLLPADTAETEGGDAE